MNPFHGAWGELRTVIVLMLALLLSVPSAVFSELALNQKPATADFARPVLATAESAAPSAAPNPMGTGENEWRGAARPLGRLRHAMAYDSRADRIVLFGGTSGAADLDDTWTYDFEANTWTIMNPTTKPSARGRHAMAYDAQSDRVILFGGSVGGTALDDTWAYNLNTNTWTIMNPTTKPSARYRHAMAYDAQSDRVILFGGIGTNVLDDTWSYDFETNTWTNVNPSFRPSARYRHAMAYDYQMDRVMMFGGFATADLGDMWAFDLNTNTWTNKTPSTGPSARSYPAMAYDAESRRVVLFGGTGTSILDDTWAYDFISNSWLNMNPGSRPSARSYPAMAYDTQSDRVVLFGGTSGATDLGDTWAYDLNTNSWNDMNPATRPSGRGRHAMAYDSRSDRVIMFGGSATDLLGDTWAYDLNINRWTNKKSAASPPARFDSAMAYDSQSDRLVLFGGNTTKAMNDTWAYDFTNNTWRNMNPGNRPAARDRHAVVYDSRADRVILFGGFGTTTMNDTWAYDLNTNTWTNLTPPNPPSARYRPAMAYDAQSDRVVLFGGTGAAVFNDTWSYDFNNNTWQNQKPVTSPPARYRHAMSYDARLDRVVLFGGTSGPAALGDTWSYNLNTNTWTNMNPAPTPSARYRHAMAYDSQSEQVVLFGGFNPASAELGDTWSYALLTNTWTDVNRGATPPGRQLSASAYDSQSDRVVLFGGSGTALRGDTWTYDLNTNSWMNMGPAIRPPARSGHAAAYNSKSDRVVLFGGTSGPSSFGDTWSYDVNTNTWKDLSPAAPRPPPRSGHAMAYDARSDRVILFGGSSGGTLLNDTWSYDSTNNTWTNMDPPTTRPLSRSRHAVAYDSRSARVVLFGGTATTGPLDDTWSYDFKNNTWASVSPVPRPPARSGHTMVYVAKPDRIVLFGGLGATVLADTWSFDFTNTTWTNLNPASPPSPRSNSVGAYDAESDQTVLFGGVISGAAVLDDTWAYDLKSNAWTNPNPTTRPSARSGHAMAYDSEVDRVVLFGGTNVGGVLDDTWAFDLNTNIWTILNPVTKPSARSRHAMAYDSESHRVVLFGGSGGTGALGDTWAFDFKNTTWTNLPLANPPPARYGHAVVYDSRSDRMVLFGGFSPATVAPLDDTWTYDLNTNTWTRMTLATQPPARVGHAMAYDAQSNRTILFGGQVAGAVSNDTWAYDSKLNTWTDKSPASRPSARSDFAMAYDAESDRVVLFGGATSGGISHETWSYDLEANRWADTKPRSKPAARSQHAMAYDTESDRVVLFGGLPLNDETWWFHHPHLPLAPLSLQAFAGNAEVTLSWAAPASDGGSLVANYRIYRGNIPGGETFLREVGPIFTFTDRPLLNGATFFYKVSGVNAAGEGLQSTEASATPQATFPTAPQNLVATGRNAQVVLRWDAPLNDGGSIITHYRIYRGNTSGGETFLVEIGANLTFTDTGLTNGVTYYYEVSAVTIAGESARSNEGVATPQTTPSAVQNLTARPDNAQVTLDWRAPLSDGGSPITNYSVYRGNTVGGETFLLQVGDVLSYTDSNLTNGRTYYYQVKAKNGKGEGPPSTEVSGAPRTVPAAPRSVLASPGDGVVNLTWAAPASEGGSPVTNYRIYRGTPPGSKTLLIEVGIVFSFADTTVTNGVTYIYQVSAVNIAGEGPRSLESSTIPNRFLPTMPLNLQATGGNGRVNLTWAAPASTGGSPITNYRIYRGTTAGAEAFLIEVGVIFTFTDTGRTNRVTYYYEVSAVNSYGEGPRSNETSATPSPVVPTAPRFFRASGGFGKVNLTWTAPSSDGGASLLGYKLYRGTMSGGEGFLILLANGLSFTDSNVTNGVTYYYQVSAVNGVGEGPRSGEDRATPKTPPDTTNPTVAIASPAPGAVITTSTITVTGTAADDVAVATVELSLDGTKWFVAAGTSSWSGTLSLPDGSNTIHARATDTSGHTNTTTVSVVVQRPWLGLDPTLLPLLLLAIPVTAFVGILAAFVIWSRRTRRRFRRS